jgi:hypothetical protein
MVKTQRHRDTKAQRKPASNRFYLPAFFVPLCLCVFVFNNSAVAAAQSLAKPYTPPKTAWGDPDI